MNVVFGWVLPALLTLAVWMYAVGVGQLDPSPAAFEAASRWTPLLWLTGVCQAASVVILFVGLRKGLQARLRTAGTDSTLAAWLATAFWVGAAHGGNGWWLTSDPGQAEVNVALAAGLVCLWNELGIFTIVVCVVLAATHHGAAAFTLAAATLGQLGVTIWAAPILALVALVRQGLAPEGTLLDFWWAWLLPWAVVALIGRKERAGGVVRTLALWELASWSSGLYPLGAAGAIVGIWVGRGLGQRWNVAQPKPSVNLVDGSRPRQDLLAPWSAWVVALSLLFSWQALCPGEEWFNRRLLIARENAGVSLKGLYRPETLDWWVEHRGSAYAFDAADIATVDWLKDHARGKRLVVLTPSEPDEPRQVAQVLSALLGAPPLGWSGNTLTAAAQAIRLGGPADGCGADFLVMRGPHTAPSTPSFGSGATAVYALKAPEPAAGEVKGAAFTPPAPGALWPVQLSDGKPHRAHWQNEDLSMTIQGPAARIPSPLASGHYELIFDGSTPLRLGPYALDRDACLGSLKLNLTLPASVPSRSLVPAVLDLTQNGPCPLDLAAERGVQIQCSPPRGEPSTLSAPIQPLKGRLEPGKIAHFNVLVATPEMEGDCPVEIRLVGADGSSRILDPARRTVHTWRRWPPIAF